MSTIIDSVPGTNHPPEVSPGERHPLGGLREGGKPDQKREVSPPDGPRPPLALEVGEHREVVVASVSVTPSQ